MIGGKKRIYLVCDPTTPEDLEFSRDIHQKIADEKEFAVELPLVETPGALTTANPHEQLLRECDGLLRIGKRRKNSGGPHGGASDFYRRDSTSGHGRAPMGFCC